MSDGYTTVFDLAAHPDAIRPAWWFYALFVAAGLIFAVIAVVCWRRRTRRRWFHLLFAVAWNTLLPLVIVPDVRATQAARRLVDRGEASEVAGCLDAFHAGAAMASRSGDSDERWSVGGVRFRYGAGDVSYGYHRVVPHGGAVRADSAVRVVFVPDANGGSAIVRLAVRPHACPPAPDRSE